MTDALKVQALVEAATTMRDYFGRWRGTGQMMSEAEAMLDALDAAMKGGGS